MPSIGNDLALIREHRGYTLEDIHQSTKIPIETLKSIESGKIFHDSTEILTYVRSFVRTYGRALKLDDDLLTKALDQEDIGNYNHLLLKDYPELKEEAGEEETFEPTDKTDKEKKSESWEYEADKEDESASESAAPKANAPKAPGVRNIDWADMGKDFKTSRVNTPVWIISAAMIVILVVAAAFVIYQYDFFSSGEIVPTQPEQTEQQTPANDSDLSLDLTDEEPVNDEGPATLDEIMTLTLYAAYDRLDPVRVWSDEKPRIDPYWVEQGVAYNFEFQDTIRISGQYSRMLLFLNGNRIENFRQQHFNDEENAVELTRSSFETDPQWATSGPFELPEDVSEPDTVINRPTFQ